MRVLIVVDTLGPSGGERSILALLPILIKSGLSFEVAALMAPYTLAPEFEAIGVRVHKLDLGHRWSLLQGIVRLKTVSDAGRFQTIWSTLYFGHLYSALLKVSRPELRLILWLQSPGYTNSLYRGVWHSVRARIHGWVIRKADRVIACSNAVARDFEASFRLAPLSVIYNGVPHDSLPGQLPEGDQQQVRDRFGVPRDAPLITVVARYSIDKGHTHLLDAICVLENEHGIRAYCVAAGQGSLKDALEAQARRLGIAERVTFVGTQDHSDVHRLMQSSDVVVLPSVQECLGMAAIESMALGTPTVLSDYYGLAEVAADGAAFTAQPGDAQSLASALHRALSDQGARATVTALARKRVDENFTVKKIAPQWLEVLIAGGSSNVLGEDQ